MSEPFVGEIRMFAGNFAPRGWAFADGQLLAVSSNDALFSLYGTIYGGDGRTTFGLPDLRGRIPIHAGGGPGLTNRRLGSKAGVENVTLTTNQIPPHNHGALRAINQNGGTNQPMNNYLANSGFGDSEYAPSSDANATMNSEAVSSTGGSRSHTNLMPAQCINYIVALFGIYPSRS